MTALEDERAAHWVCVKMRDDALAENERLRAALTVFISAAQTGRYPSDEVEAEAIKLCGGMGAIHAYEQNAAGTKSDVG